MSEWKGKKPPSAHVRQAECEALRTLSPAAAKMWIAIRYGQDDRADIEIGVRDFENWGLNRSVAARALAEIVGAGLLRIVRESTFGAKRTRRVFAFAYTKAAEIQSRERDTAIGYSPPRRTRRADTVPPAGHGKALQSRWRDIPKELASPSAKQAEGEGSGDTAPPPEGRVAVASPRPPGLGERQEGSRNGMRAGMVALDALALRLGLRCFEATKRLGGPVTARQIALAVEKGELTLAEVIELQAVERSPARADAGRGEVSLEGMPAAVAASAVIALRPPATLRLVS